MTDPQHSSPVSPARPARGEGNGSNPSGGAPARDRGHGQRLIAAFEAMEAFPALAASRNRLVALAGAQHPSSVQIANAIESDVALVISVMRLANNSGGPGEVETVRDAVDVLTPERILRLASRAETFDFFERAPVWNAAPERFRLHAVSVQRVAERLAVETGVRNRPRLLVIALLHDIGKLVLGHAYRSYPKEIHGDARTPEERLHREQRELGVDHALVGGVLARRWNLPQSIAAGIERHHADDASGDAALVRLADMLGHYVQGMPVSGRELKRAAGIAGLQAADLRRVLSDLPYPTSDRPKVPDPCPLSSREMDVLRLLSEGMVYKQIATELTLSTSTVRTHLHNIYSKLGAVDRAQAVLQASQRGWL